MRFHQALAAAACVVHVFVVAAQASGNKPEALALMEAARRLPHTADIYLRMESNGRRHVMNYRMAGDDQVVTDYGNDDGLQEEIQPGKPYSYSYVSDALLAGSQWHYREEGLIAHQIPDRTLFRPMMDIRTLGMFPIPQTLCAPGECDPPDVLEYEITKQGDLCRVTGKTEDGGSVIWELDPAKTFAPLRVTRMAQGVVIAEVRNEYEQTGNYWFPARSTYTLNGTLYATYTVTSASFDHPAHSTRLTPNDLGLFPGINVSHEGDSSGPSMWDGSGCIDIQTFIQRRKDGQIDNSRFLDLVNRHERGEAPGLTPKKRQGLGPSIEEVRRTPRLWEEYVRRFIQVHKLPRRECDKAWELLKSCQKPAYRYLDEKRDDFQRLRREQVALERTEDETARRELERIRGDLDKLYRPIDTAFDTMLKPKLELLKPKGEPNRAATP